MEAYDMTFSLLNVFSIIYVNYRNFLIGFEYGSLSAEQCGNRREICSSADTAPPAGFASQIKLWHFHPALRRTHEHRASPFQHDRAADPSLECAGRRHPRTAGQRAPRRLRARGLSRSGLHGHRNSPALRPEHARPQGRGAHPARTRGAQG
ncbi:protein of unknown function [Thiomonas sp. Sup16B3]|nr:protein of unknown function [Thiomonas sp. Sup16B3]